jgi:HAD superfamily hydrolase (TIGR01549 family)
MRLDAASVQAVLFDLDGVLIDSYEVWFRVMNAAALEFGRPPISREAFHGTWGQGVEADVERFFPGVRVEALVRYYDEHFPDHLAHLRIDSDAAPVFTALEAAGLRTGVITNTPTPLARELVARVGIEPGAVVGGTDVARAKPAPDMVEHACELLGVAPAAALVVGDSRYDREAAAAARLPFVGLRTHGDRRIERLRDLPLLLGCS